MFSSDLPDRFVVSYDLWEEKFRVVKTQSPVRRVDHLTAAGRGKMVLDQMAIDVSGVAPTRAVVGPHGDPRRGWQGRSAVRPRQHE